MDNNIQKLPSFVRIWLYEYIKKFATIQGRANRTQYWYSVLCVFVTFAVLEFLSYFPILGGLFYFVQLLFLLACLIPFITSSTRRLHDSGLSGLWILQLTIVLVCVNILGGIYLVSIYGEYASALIGAISNRSAMDNFSVDSAINNVLIGSSIFSIGYFIVFVGWLVLMVKPSNVGANKFGEPAEIKKLTSFKLQAE